MPRSAGKKHARFFRYVVPSLLAPALLAGVRGDAATLSPGDIAFVGYHADAPDEKGDDGHTEQQIGDKIEDGVLSFLEALLGAHQEVLRLALPKAMSLAQDGRDLLARLFGVRACARGRHDELDAPTGSG